MKVANDLEYARPVVKRVAFKKMIDIMKWTGESTFEEVVANSLDSRWQHLKETEDERLSGHDQDCEGTMCYCKSRRKRVKTQ